MTFVDNGNGTATLAGTPAAGTGGTYPLTITAANGVGSNAVAELHADGQSGAGVHQRERHDVHRRQRRHVHGDDDAASRPSPTIVRTGALAHRRDVRRQRQRHRDAERHTRRRHRRRLPLTFTINNGVGGNVVQNFTLTVTEAPAFTSAAATTFTAGSAEHVHRDDIGTTRRHDDHARRRGIADRRDLRQQRQRHRDAERHA